MKAIGATTRKHTATRTFLFFAASALYCTILSACALQKAAHQAGEKPAPEMEDITLSADSAYFIYRQSGARFTPWGFNYDHDSSGRLIEDYWAEEWQTVEADFREMQLLGANVVRVHLQLGKFMRAPSEPNEQALKQLSNLLTLAEKTGLYLNITGLGNYHRNDVPAWYAEMKEQERWETQAAFWSAIAEVCAGSPAVFCYDLMNEPLWPSEKKESDWLAGEFGGKFFCQRITLDLEGRDPHQVARKWIEKLTGAIRSKDTLHLITLGAIPWALSFPGAKPMFYAKEVGENLDFVSVHFYPEKGEIDKALEALKVYDLGKPLIIEELFPLKCSIEELDTFIDSSRAITEGFIGFYWGTTIEEYAQDNNIGSLLIGGWLEYFSEKTPDILE